MQGYKFDRPFTDSMGRLETPKGLLRHLRRLVHLVYVFFLHMIVHAVYDRSYGGEEPVDRWERILYVFEDAGPTFIKFGQLLSQRPEIPKPLTDQLEKLLDWGPLVSPELLHKRLEEEIESVNEVFTDFKDEPIASASLAQVHEVQLPSGERAAVKIRKPGLIDRINTDLDILRLFGRYLSALPPRLFQPLPSNPTFFGEFITTFEEALRKEVNFEQEGKFIEKFADVFQYNEDILVPEVYWDYTTEAVLTMEYMDGLQLNELEDWEGAGIDPRKVSAHATQAAMETYVSGMIHGDPHPANVMGTKDGKVVLLDFGMSWELDDEELDAIMRTMGAFATGDVEEVVRLFLKHMATMPSYVDKEAVIETGLSFYNRFIEEGEGGIPVIGIDAWQESDPRKTVIDDLMYIGLEHDIFIQHQFILTLKSLMYWIKTGENLWPGSPLFEIIMPYVQTFFLHRKEDQETGEVHIDRDACLREAVPMAKAVEKAVFEREASSSRHGFQPRS